MAVASTKYAAVAACNPPNSRLVAATPITGVVQFTASGCSAPRNKSSSPNPAAAATNARSYHAALPNRDRTISETRFRNLASGRHDVREVMESKINKGPVAAAPRTRAALVIASCPEMGKPDHWASHHPANPKLASNAIAAGTMC